MANGRITNATLNEKLEILLRQVGNIDGRVSSLYDELTLANEQHSQQMALLKKKCPTWRQIGTCFRSRLRA